MATAKPSLSTKQLLRDAWHRVRGSKWPFFLLLVISIVWGYILYLVSYYTNLHHWFTLEHQSQYAIFIWLLASAIASAPLVSAGVRMGLDRARGQDTSIQRGMQAWRHLHEVIIYLFIVLIFGTVVNMLIHQLVRMILISGHYQHGTEVTIAAIGFIIAELLTIAVSTLFALGVPFILERRASIFGALFMSYRLVGRNFSVLYSTLITIYILTFVALIPAGIGLIWVMPLTYIVIGRAYLALAPQ